METQIGLFAKVGAGLSALLGGVFGLGKYNAVLVKKKELYKDGQSIYLTVDKSKENIADCRNVMSKEIEGVNDNLDEIKVLLKERNDKDVVNAEVLGGIKQFMIDHAK